MMTKKDFEALAAALAESQASNAVVDGIARACVKSGNPKFDRKRFTKAARYATPEELKRRETIRQMADDQHSESEGIEIDGDAATSEGDDNGTYVAAWLWVDFAGTPLDKKPDQCPRCEDGTGPTCDACVILNAKEA